MLSFEAEVSVCSSGSPDDVSDVDACQYKHLHAHSQVFTAATLQIVVFSGF